MDVQQRSKGVQQISQKRQVYCHLQPFHDKASIYIYIIYIYIIIHIFWFWNLPRNICKFLGTHSQPQFFHCEDDTCFFRRQGIPRVHSTSAFPSIQVLALILMEPLIAPGKSSLQDMSPGWMGHSAELENCSRWFFLHWKLYDLFNEYFVLYTQY